MVVSIHFERDISMPLSLSLQASVISEKSIGTLEIKNVWGCSLNDITCEVDTRR